MEIVYVFLILLIFFTIGEVFFVRRYKKELDKDDENKKSRFFYDLHKTILIMLIMTTLIWSYFCIDYLINGLNIN